MITLKKFNLIGNRFNICFSIGAAGNFGTSHSKWSTYYPGIRAKLTTLRCNTLLPIAREVILSCGGCAATPNSLTTLLNQSNDPSDEKNRDGYTSNGVVLIGGGAREAYYTFPNTYRCAIAKRRGFIRIALETGASLVPAISFGENNIYKATEMKPGFVRRLMERIPHRPNVTPAILNGRGILQYNFGWIPIRHPITTVVGSPIHLQKISNPCKEMLDETHQLFCTRLEELFEAQKPKYIENFQDVHLEFV